MNPQDQPPAGQTPPSNTPGPYNIPPPSYGSFGANNALPANMLQNGIAQPANQLPPLMPEPLKPLGQQRGNESAVSNIREQVISSLREANNVLVTVSNNPSVDQLAAAIGFTLILNKLGKHATAVFSGQAPSTIEFLQPEKTLEKNTDSLRDFIIALDKSKADKLRYKIEDKFVKIFITPYHTSLSEKDLEFSQGDFNVDVVVALGIQQREQLDQAITAHGRILHDATVISINTTDKPTDVGIINWHLPTASSLSEIMVGVSEVLQEQQQIIDGQIATAFLTGIVAETARFSNDKTTPVTMNTAGKLMDAGANQQLVATQLAQPTPEPKAKGELQGKKTTQKSEDKITASKPTKTEDGSLQVSHKEESHPQAKNIDDLQKMIEETEEEDDVDKIHIDDEGILHRLEEMKAEEERKKQEGGREGNGQTSAASASGSSMALTPPAFGSALSANDGKQGLDPTTDPLSLPAVQDGPILKHRSAINIQDDQTLADLEKAIGSPHARGMVEDSARQAVNNVPRPDEPLEPIVALNAQPLGLDLHKGEGNDDLPPQIVGPDKGLPPDETASKNPPTGPPPPVPPPMMPPTQPGQDNDNPL